MGQTTIEKILSNHSDRMLRAGDIADIQIDVRVARDFGGANVVKNLRASHLEIKDPSKTFFTFDCNPGGSDQKYATNQQMCRMFAREHNIRVMDIQSGIGTHIAIEEGIIEPGGTFVSTDSHANILGAIGAFGQGMGDRDIAAAWAYGKVWFKVPRSMKIVLKGNLPKETYAKDIALRLFKEFGASGLLGYAAEFYGEIVNSLDLASKMTIASMATEMAGIIALFPPNQNVIEHYHNLGRNTIKPVYADPDAEYDKIVNINLTNLEPLASRPGHPGDVVPVREIEGIKIDSAFIGSCTNGRFEDMLVAANILKDRKVAPGVVLKIVPATRRVWSQCLKEGLVDIFMKAGALVGNPGCAGCAEGQIGQNGPGEVTVSTGNRNFVGKQGKGDVYLASPATAAASAVAGMITTPQSIPKKPALFFASKRVSMPVKQKMHSLEIKEEKSVELKGRVWVLRKNNIDTDMIFHNRYLAITDISEMGQYTFDNLEGWKDFAQKARPGDILITGSNFGAGSSRQQAVDCFKSLRVQAIIAKSFGAIYERNAINAGLPIITSNLIESPIKTGDQITINLETGEITNIESGDSYKNQPISDIQMEIYRKGGLLNSCV